MKVSRIRFRSSGDESVAREKNAWQISRAKRRVAGGFTMVEVLIALAIFATVITAVYSSWISIVKATKVGQSAAVAAQRTRISMQIIQEAISSAEMFQANARYYGFVAENGREATLSFVARVPQSFPRSGKFGLLEARRITFSVEPGSDGFDQLVLRQAPLLMEMDKDEEIYPVVLARRVKEFKTEFLDPRVAADPNFLATSSQMWIDEWTQTNQMPKLVKVTLQFAPEGTRTVTAADALTGIINIPSVGVQPAWQIPSGQTAPATNRPPQR